MRFLSEHPCDRPTRQKCWQLLEARVDTALSPSARHPQPHAYGGGISFHDHRCPGRYRWWLGCEEKYCISAHAPPSPLLALLLRRWKWRLPMLARPPVPWSVPELGARACRDNGAPNPKQVLPEITGSGEYLRQAEREEAMGSLETILKEGTCRRNCGVPISHMPTKASPQHSILRFEYLADSSKHAASMHYPCISLSSFPHGLRRVVESRLQHQRR